MAEGASSDLFSRIICTIKSSCDWSNQKCYIISDITCAGLPSVYFELVVSQRHLQTLNYCVATQRVCSRKLTGFMSCRFLLWCRGKSHCICGEWKTLLGRNCYSRSHLSGMNSRDSLDSKSESLQSHRRTNMMLQCDIIERELTWTLLYKVITTEQRLSMAVSALLFFLQRVID